MKTKNKLTASAGRMTRLVRLLGHTGGSDYGRAVMDRNAAEDLAREAYKNGDMKLRDEMLVEYRAAKESMRFFRRTHKLMDADQLTPELDKAAEGGSQHPLVSRSLIAEQFRRYEIARERQHWCEQNRREGTFGIAIHKDDMAVEWQGCAKDVEESRAFFENRRPIPECWGEKSQANVKDDESPPREKP